MKIVALFFLICCVRLIELQSPTLLNGSSNPFIYSIMQTDCKGKQALENAGIVVNSNEDVELTAVGDHLTSKLEVGITKYPNCGYVYRCTIEEFPKSHGHLATLSFTAPPTSASLFSQVEFYFCIQEGEDWVLQKDVSISVYKTIDTFWLMIVVVTLCFCLSSLMSGLNIGLFTVDKNELDLLKKSGTTKERKYAKKIIPVRRNGNYLLCSILLTCTLCNSIGTVFIDNMIPSGLAVVITTFIIVFFCEILPQAICTRNPLSIGAKTIYITYTCMILTFPISYPLSFFLNWILGKEFRETYSKERLRELLKMTRLDASEEKIIVGTLDLSTKKVEDVMTLLDDIYTLPITAVMSFETIASVLVSGYSRIPVYEGSKSNIRYILLTKDLAIIDPDDNIPVRLLVRRTTQRCRYVPVGTSLDTCLGLFKESRLHMAFVVSNNVEQENDVDVVGLITFEDVIEEIFQVEINDETDSFTDNRSKRKLTREVLSNDFISLLTKAKAISKAIAPSENLKLAAYHFLSEIDVFSTKYISPKVLFKLMALDVYQIDHAHSFGEHNEGNTVYQNGVAADYFVMVLEGQMEVKFGCESLKFEAGPFKYFGVEALRPSLHKKSKPFVADYTVIVTKRTMYMKIPQVIYQAALLATQFEQTKEQPSGMDTKSDLYGYFNFLIGNDDEDPSKS